MNISKLRQRIHIIATLKDRRHLHYSVCIPNDQKSNVGRVHTKHVLWTTKSKYFCIWYRRESERKVVWSTEKNVKASKEIDIEKIFSFCRSDNESWFGVVAVLVKMLHVLQPNNMWFFKLIHFFSLRFLFDSFVGCFTSYEVGRRLRWQWQPNPLKTFIQINAHTLNIQAKEHAQANAHAIVHHIYMKRNLTA